MFLALAVFYAFSVTQALRLLKQADDNIDMWKYDFTKQRVLDVVMPSSKTSDFSCTGFDITDQTTSGLDFNKLGDSNVIDTTIIYAVISSKNELSRHRKEMLVPYYRQMRSASANSSLLLYITNDDEKIGSYKAQSDDDDDSYKGAVDRVLRFWRWMGLCSEKHMKFKYLVMFDDDNFPNLHRVGLTLQVLDRVTNPETDSKVLGRMATWNPFPGSLYGNPAVIATSAAVRSLNVAF